MRQNEFIIRSISLTTAVIAFFLFLSPGVSAESLLDVYVVNYPLKYFAERIGGPHVKVTLPAPPDVDPAYWVPSITAIGAYQQADLILLNGAGYAKWVNKVSLPRSKTIDTSKQFKDRYITGEDIMNHSHGPEGAHAHEALAFTTWLDLTLADQQAEAIAAAMSRKRPELRKTFQTNYATLANELEAMDRHIQSIVSQNSSTPLIVSHPVYDYFARRYGLNIVSVHWEPDQIPDDGQWIELKKILKQHPAEWMVWEGEPVETSVEKLTAIGIRNIVFNPCGNVPQKGDFMSVMEQNIENLKPLFR
ncbi:metal ABC transporter substrate-binding protein [Thermodesulfobacteriota bacterium]